MGLCVSMHIDGERKQRKRLATAARNDDFKVPQLLANIPGRLWSNGVNRNSCLFSKHGGKGVNQDCMLVWEGFTDESTLICSVLDGHGPNGHRVAHTVRDTLPTLLMNTAADMLQPDWGKRLAVACAKMDEQLQAHPYINCAGSGTTMVTAFLQAGHITVGNVGDSRAIMGKRNGSNWTAEQLTVDLKPNVPEELERIRRCRGRVFALADEPHVARLWLPSGKTPGLAMARAFGDFLLKDYGLIASPEVIHRQLSDDDRFLVLATDGVWDVLSNQEVVEIIASCPCKLDTAKTVVDMAVKQWKAKRPKELGDDCTVVCHFFEADSDGGPSLLESRTAMNGPQANVLTIATSSRPEPW